MEFDPQKITEQLVETWAVIQHWATSPEFYAQLAAIACAVLLAFLSMRGAQRWIKFFADEPVTGKVLGLRTFLFQLQQLIFPILNILFLEIAVDVGDSVWKQSALIRLAQSVALIFLVYTVATRFVPSRGMRGLVQWIGIPIGTLHVFGVLDDVSKFLDDIALTAGDIHISAYALLRTLIFGAVLFWLGRLSNTVGKDVIRNRQSLDIGTREVFAKLFEIGVFVVIFLLLLQVMGINLTALAVFGGALGVGLGFGLQQIASNFVSGIIILLDRSITIGDHVELEDGRNGTLRELNMRYGILETFDGKDIMVPNEKFITSSYTNWTHKNKLQRYPLKLQVAYSTDLDLLFDNIRAICAAHPKVLSGDDLPIEIRPDAEIAGFGDNGIDILVEFWMEGIDDGENRVGADLLHSIWRSIQENGMQIPFPQREVRILND
jgi:small-conductance mechanosensitive channel